ncbi:hypothetical protein [Endothiovibrio diazotrophicus]
MGASLSKEAIAAVKAEIAKAKHGSKTSIVKAAARTFGVSVATVYRGLNGEGHRGPKREREAPNPQYEEWAALLSPLINKGPKHKIPTWIALESAVKSGLLPEEAQDVPVATFNRYIRKLGGRNTTRKVNRMWSEYANEAVQFDASTSEYFSVLRQLDDGDYLLRLNKRVHQVYKNKPLSKERLRVCIYGIWEMHSGYQLSRYVAAKGENGFDAIDFLMWAFAPKDDPRIPYHGKPSHLWADQGPVTKLGATVDLLKRLELDLEKGKAYAKERMGGVEGTHGKRWRSFESTYFLMLSEEFPNLEIRLSELNRHLTNYLVRMNDRPARFQPNLSKKDAWQRSINQQGGAQLLPENAMETLVTEVRRFVDQAGIAQWNNEYYALRGNVHSRWVVLRRSLTDASRVIAEDVETGERWEAQRWTPPVYGEIRGHHTSGAEKAAAAGANLRITHAPYGEDGEEVPALRVIAKFQRPSRPAEPLADPLDAGTYPDIDSAMNAFMAIYNTPLTETHHQMVIESIEQHGRKKDHVRDLAQQMSKLVKRSAAR